MNAHVAVSGPVHRVALAVGLCLVAWFCVPRAVAGAVAVSDGGGVYLEGRLPGGGSLRGDRGGGAVSEGSGAACVNCHRRSGLGSAEGNTRIPPITAKYLFSPGGSYDDASAAAAIRNGVGRSGRVLNPVMPRYDLDVPQMTALLSYLKSLPTTPSPGVSDSTIDLATIVTPDADPIARDGMLAVLQQFVADKNAFQRGGAKPLRSAEPIHFRVTRAWRLHVWTLTGRPDTWERQLKVRLHAEPVFAVLAGIGGDTWAPVHHFCESERLPCLFPNIDVPVDLETDFYSIYLSKGALLDAELIASRLADVTPAGRLVQIHGTGKGAVAAAARLERLASAFSSRSTTIQVARGDAAGLAGALASVGAHDTLVLWLKPDELAALSPAPPQAADIYVSGTLGGLERTRVPAAWRQVVQLAYPADLPAARVTRMNYPLRWFQIRQVDVVAEKVQADTYLACGIVSEALNEMLESFMRDYLVERIEAMVSHRQLSGYYPRLGLGTGQRFASKGGYLVRFTDDSGQAITPVSDWIVP